MSDEDLTELSEEEDEILVYVEFEGFVDNSTFSNERLQLDMAGFDSDFPVMQINGKFYEGTYEDAVGTYLFFEKDDNPTVDDPVFDTVPTLKYFAKTRKLLKMQRVFAKQRTDVLGDSDHTYCIPNMDTIKQAGIPPKYQEDALRFWKKMRNDRMEALKAYLDKQRIREEKRLQGIEPESESDEDDPFAMYKPKKNGEGLNRNPENDDSDLDKVINSFESESIESTLRALNRTTELVESNKDAVRKSKKSQKKLTVIDPGPSTSKDSMSYVALAPPISRKKHRATVKAVKKSKVKDVFKKPNKRAPRKRKPPAPNDVPCEDVAEVVEILTSESGAQEAQETEIKEEMEASNDTRPNGQDTSDENKRTLPQEVEQSVASSQATMKIMEKQAKREVKMREISERLKTDREEFLRMQSSLESKARNTVNTSR